MVLPIAAAGMSKVKDNPVLALIPIAAVGGLGFVGYKMFKKVTGTASAIVGAPVKAVKAVGKGIYNVGAGTGKLAKRATRNTFKAGKKATTATTRAFSKAGKGVFNVGKTVATSKTTKRAVAKVNKQATKAAKKATKTAKKAAKKAKKKLKKLKFW